MGVSMAVVKAAMMAVERVVMKAAEKVAYLVEPMAGM
jgi:hypothetical protein